MKNNSSDILGFILCMLTIALPVGLILAAPVMREPTQTISATAYFGNAQ